METVVNKLEWLFAGFVTFVSWYFGGADGFLYALIALTVTDYITGMIAAWVNNRLSSSIGFKGIGKKVGIFAIVGVTHVLDAQLLGHGEVLRNMTIFYYLANEGISILENAVEMGIQVPDFLKEKLSQIRNDPQRLNKQELM